MKKLFLESRFKGKVDLKKISLSKLPKKVGIISSVQFLDCVNEIKDYLEESGKEVYVGKGKQGYNGQVLGCDVSSAIAVSSKVDAFLYIGDGRFHPLGVANNEKKDVFCFSPISNSFSRIKKEEIEKYNKFKNIRKVKFLSSDNIGVLVSLKQGQNNFDQVNKLKKKYEKKNFFIFVFETLNINEIENFPFIESWVNTACPRIEEDSKKIINYYEL